MNSADNIKATKLNRITTEKYELILSIIFFRNDVD
jgi:hypothetical protein